MLEHRTKVISTFAFAIYGILLLTINGFIVLLSDVSSVPLSLVLPGVVSLGVAYYIHNWGSCPREHVDDESCGGVDGN